MFSPANSSDAIGRRIARNFFSHCSHVPLVLIILEYLLSGSGYFFQADAYVLLLAGVGHACVAARVRAHRADAVFLSNLVGAGIYTTVEFLLEGKAFFGQWHHLAYWVFSIMFACVQAAQVRLQGWPRDAMVMAENVLRSAIPLVMYAVFEAQIKAQPLSFFNFLQDPAHDFLAIILIMLGVLLGLSDVNLRRSMAMVDALTSRLKQFSEWSMGRGILERAIADDRTLLLQRVNRYVLFLDIRGFTAWSELQLPERVAQFLGSFYEVAELATDQAAVVKVKYTADEVMVVLADGESAFWVARRMLESTRPLLAAQGLSVGAGLHAGPVVEGVLGSASVRAYDFIGDTVNTAKRLCDAAGGGELMASQVVCEAANEAPSAWRFVTAKGKRQPVQAGVFKNPPDTGNDQVHSPQEQG